MAGKDRTNKAQWKITKLASDSPEPIKETPGPEKTPPPIDTDTENSIDCPTCKRLNTFQISTDKAHRTCTECFYHAAIVAQSWRDTPPEPTQETPEPVQDRNGELKRKMDEESIPKKYLVAMQQARAALAHLPGDFPALKDVGKKKEQYHSEKALHYLSDLMKIEKYRDRALRTIQEKLPIWQAAAQQKEVGA